MKVTATVDRDDVAADLEKNTVTEVIWDCADDYGIQDGRLSELIDAVIKNVRFEFDRSDVELAAVLQFPELTR